MTLGELANRVNALLDEHGENVELVTDTTLMWNTEDSATVRCIQYIPSLDKIELEIY